MTTIKIRPAVGATAFILLVSGFTPALATAGNRNRNGNGNSPAGNSAINQYVESFPTAGGGKPTRGIGGHHGHGSGGSGGTGAVSPSTQRAMSNSGSAGQDAVAFANATAPSTGGVGQTGGGVANGGKHPGASGAGPGGRSGAPGAGGLNGSGDSGNSSSSGGSSPVSSVLSAFVGSSSNGGLGLWLPVLLIVVLLGGCAIGLRHRSRRGSS